jgi:hypothetical protein
MYMNRLIELEVMGIIASGLTKLEGDIEAIRRVLQWAGSAHLPDALPQTAVTVTPTSGNLSMSSPPPDQPSPNRTFSTLPDLYSAASPGSDSERALVVGYWFQSLLGEQDLDGFQINKELKHLGHGISNITTALSSLIERKPQLVIQTRKSGNSKQARKRYRLTDAGVKAVDRLLAGGEV